MGQRSLKMSPNYGGVKVSTHFSILHPSKGWSALPARQTQAVLGRMRNEEDPGHEDRDWEETDSPLSEML